MSIPVSGAICERLSSVVRKLMEKIPTNDGSLENIGILEVDIFIMLNGSESVFKICKFLKATLIKKCVIPYFQHFKPVSSNVAFRHAVTSKVVSSFINDSDKCLLCFYFVTQ